MSKSSRAPQANSSSRQSGKIGTQQHNKDRLGSNSGPMGEEDQRKDKFGSLHNQDAQGLQSNETQRVRKTLSKVRQSRRRRPGSR